ncbi:MAG: CBS domain-containing protein [Candidatus Avispirillum sp.]
MKPGELFLNTYRDLEELLCAKYGMRSGAVQEFAAREGKRYSEDLNLCRDIRNLLSHHAEVDGSDAVIPSEAVQRRLEEILAFAKDPPRALSVSTRLENLFRAEPDDKVSYLTDAMERRGYSHVPVLDKEHRLTGVFSVSTLFSYAKRHPDFSFKELTVVDMADCLPPESHATEKFGFVDRDAGLGEIRDSFRSNGPASRRVAAVFVTSDGTAGGKVLGMITPWDIIKKEK